ncbi:MAG TPA: adenylyl cyclase [Streptosporangiaceae bacterium]
MPQSQIQATVNAIATQQVPNQFGTQRYALLFEPGTYGSAANPLIFQVGYYTEVAGLGASPGDVVINGSVDVFNQCFAADNSIALDNFWRSMSNLTINAIGLSGCQANTEFWAVSQAAPMRRVQVNGQTSFMDYCSAGPQFASGGFVADSAFTGGSVVNGSQQQFIVRNSNLDGWSNGVWDQVFAGDNGAPAQSFGTPGGQPYTTLATTPVSKETPFLYTTSNGRFRVLVPGLRRNSVGPSWTSGSEAGRSIRIGQFFIASPSTSVGAINAALASGRNLILTPGVYQYSQPIQVTRAHTVVLGMGFPTLIPTAGNAALTVANVAGANLSGFIVDAGPVNSPVLVQVGSPGAPVKAGHKNDPTLLADVFFRIGGAEAGTATDALVVNSSQVILDDIWSWRADHGAGVGWTSNVADHGLVVNGDDVTALGLFVEHYEQTQVVWNGEGGTTIFFQNEDPYDPPSQAAWMDGTSDGYPAFEVASNVRSFSGYGLASYCFFELGIPIQASEAFSVPSSAPGVKLHDILTRFLSGSGQITSVVDGTGAAVTTANPGPTYIVSFP